MKLPSRRLLLATALWGLGACVHVVSVLSVDADASTADGSAVDAGPSDPPDGPPAIDLPRTEGGPAPDAPSATPDDAVRADATGGSCESASEIRDGDVLTDQRFGDGPLSAPVCEPDSPTTGPTRWYRATVPAGAVLQIDVTPGEMFLTPDLVVSTQSSCGGACLQSSYSVTRRVAQVFRHNTSGAAESLLISVTNRTSSSDRRPMTIAAHVLAPAVNATCATATPLVPGVTLRGQSLGLTTELLGDCLNPDAPGFLPALYYTITVPPRTALVATAHDIDPGEPTRRAGSLVAIRPPCGVAGCLPLPPADWTSFDSNRQYNNTSDAPQPVLVAVAYSSAGFAPTVDVTATLRPLPPNVACVGAATLRPGVDTRVEHLADATEIAPRCSSTGGSDLTPLYYAIDVPPGRTLTVGAAPDPDWLWSVPSLRLFAGCTSACLATSDPVERASRVAYANTGADVQPVIVAVGGANPYAADSTAVVRTTLRPTAASVTCATAPTLSPGDTALDIDPLEAQDAPPCPSIRGPVQYYAVRVTPGATLTLTTTVDGGGDYFPSLAVVAGCGGVCLAQSNDGPTLAYVHRGAAQTVIVAVGPTLASVPSTSLVTLSARLVGGAP